MKLRWWTPLVAVPLGLLAVLGVASMAGVDVRGRLREAVERLDARLNRNTAYFDDGTHTLYFAWDRFGMQEAEVDGCSVSPAAIVLHDDVVTVIGAEDEEGFSIWQDTPFGMKGELATIPADPWVRLGLRLAAAPEADGGLALRAERLLETRTMDHAFDGPALLAGVQRGDVLLAVDGLRPATPERLREALRVRPGDDPLPLIVRRDGAERELVLRPLALTPENFWQLETQAAEDEALAMRGPDQGTDTSR